MRKSIILSGAAFLFFLNSQLSISQTSALPVENQILVKEIFKELIEINTTSSIGSTKAAMAMAARLKNAGFEDSDIGVVGPTPEHKNLVVRYKGTGRLRPILFICHLDVVEAFTEDWSFDPFVFLEKDGYFYGRGTTDVKSEDAELIANLIRLKKEKFIPDRDIIVALTDGEEGGNFNGIYWLLRNHRDLIDAEYAINPDGGGGDLKNNEPFAESVQTSEKIYISYELEARNKGGHSSLPVKDNAIYKLSSALLKIAAYEFPINLNETTKNLFHSRAQIETGQTRADMIALAADPADTAAANRLAASSAYFNAMMRTTCVATLINGGHAENALPQSVHATINCRMLPDEDPDNLLKTLNRVIADTSVTISAGNSPFVAPLSPLRDDVLDAVQKVSASLWSGVNTSAVMSTGATDGRFLRREGIPVYGVSGMFGDPADVRAHGRDERIGISDFYDGVEFMYRFIRQIAIIP